MAMDALTPVVDIGGNGNGGWGDWGGALIGGAIGGAVGSAWGNRIGYISDVRNHDGSHSDGGHFERGVASVMESLPAVGGVLEK